LVLQGDNDPRVPKEEAEQVVELLKKYGKTVDAHYYPNEGHGFAKRENQIDSIRRTVDWFDKYLK
jgi:dipeptidyl aminopeptidase/acylaminoacyl peptidase